MFHSSTKPPIAGIEKAHELIYLKNNFLSQLMPGLIISLSAIHVLLLYYFQSPNKTTLHVCPDCHLGQCRRTISFIPIEHGVLK